eukprot:878812-Pyramimonas_sp.AAC.1
MNCPRPVAEDGLHGRRKLRQGVCEVGLGQAPDPGGSSLFFCRDCPHPDDLVVVVAPLLHCHDSVRHRLALRVVHKRDLDDGAKR